MAFDTALRARIEDALAAASLTAPVDWNRRPQGAYPAVTLTTVSAPRSRHMTAFDRWQWARVQIDAMALKKGEVVALRNAVIAGIEPSGLFGATQFLAVQDVTVRDLSEQDDTQFVFRDMIEATLWYMET